MDRNLTVISRPLSGSPPVFGEGRSDAPAAYRNGWGRTRALFAAVTFILVCSTLHAQDLERIGQEKPVKITGSVSARGTFYGVDGIRQRRSPLAYILSGQVNVNLYDLSFPFSFSYSNQDRSFSQPFNQFGVSPRYKWITGHLGYRNLTFSPYTMAGHQILGGGLELTPGDFRLSFVAGRLKQAVQADTADSTILQREGASYERTGFAGRIGYGSDAASLDVMFLKAKDDTASISNPAPDGDLMPAENLVIGATAALRFFKGMNLQVTGAISDYTRDLRSDSIPLSGVAESFGDVIPPRLSTQVYTALNAGLTYQTGNFYGRFDYVRVDPDYQSMGAYFLNSDVQSFTFTPSISLAKNRLSLSAILQYQHDNLQNKKLATTSRIAPSLNVAWSPGTTFGLNLNVADMLTSQAAGRLPLNDTTMMEQHNPTIILSPRYVIADTSVSHAFYLTGMHSRLIDNNAFTAQYTEYNTTSADLSYNLDLSKSALSLTGSVSTTRLENLGGEFYTSGFALGGTKGLMEQRLNLNAGLSMSFQEGGNTLSVGLGGTFKGGDHHNLSLNFSMTSANGSNSTISSFTEYTGTAGYAYNF